MLEIVPNIWLFQINSLYLPRQKVAFGYPGKFPARGKPLSTLPNFTNANHAIGYAAECGEQDFIDTTPFKRVASATLFILNESMQILY